MVKSGLNVDPAQRKEIRVSPYRLATHLGFAFTTYTLLLWTGMCRVCTFLAVSRIKYLCSLYVPLHCMVYYECYMLYML